VEAGVPVAETGETVVTASAGKLTAQVRIRTREVQIGKPSDGRPAVIESNCTYSKYPCSLVDHLTITVNGRPLFIPRSIFCDLADLTSAELRASEPRSALILYGGDASEAYIVKIEFDATQVKSRTLSSGLSPSEPLQETIYHAVVLGE
jgi:hypothetical protein